MLWYTTETRKKLISSSLLDIISGCDGLVCYNDEAAVEALAVLKESNIEIPGQLAVVSFDGSVYSSLSSPKLTSLILKRIFGSLAAKKLINIIKGYPEQPYVLPWSISEKEST